MKKKFFYLMILALMPIMFTACSDDDDGIGSGSIPEELLGTWHCYDGSLHLYFTFNADGTGTGAVDGRTMSNKYAFVYGVKNNKVTCKGSESHVEYDGSDSYVNENWNTTFTLSESTLTGGPYSGARSIYKK